MLGNLLQWDLEENITDELNGDKRIRIQTLFQSTSFVCLSKFWLFKSF